MREFKAEADIVRDQDRPSQCCAILEGFAYGRWEADAGGKKIGGHWTNVLMNEGGQWRTALHTWTLEQ